MYVGGTNGYDTTDTLVNYLRRGPDPLFQPSQPAYYIKASSEQDTLLGVNFALENSYKLSVRGAGTLIRPAIRFIVAAFLLYWGGGNTFQVHVRATSSTGS